MKKKIWFSIGVVLTILLSILVFSFFRKQPSLIIEGVPTNYTKEYIILKVKEIEGALYSFQNEKFTKNSTYYVEENIKSLRVRIKLKSGKILEKTVTVNKIDKTIPNIKSLKTNYAETKENVYFEINATDNLSGIFEYLYIIDGKEYRTQNERFEIKEVKNSVIIKIIDAAKNELLVDSAYYEKQVGELRIAKNIMTETNQDILLTVIPDTNYDLYSFNYEDKEIFSSKNTFLATRNGIIYVKTKTKDGKILSSQIEINQIDREKPKLTYQKKITASSITIELFGTDNSSKELLYNWERAGWKKESKKTFTKDLINYIVKVKDSAGNENYIVINEQKLPQKPETSDQPSTPEGGSPTSKPSPSPSSVPPTLEVRYVTTPVTELVLTVVTENENLISFQYGEWTQNKTITLRENQSDYSIRVKNKEGLITEKKVAIKNIVKEKTTEEKNQELIQQIYNTYGFNVNYGPSAGGFRYKGKQCEILKDHEVANKALLSLQSALRIFPKDFFRNFQGKNGYRVTFYNFISEGIAGLASYEIGDDNRMILNANLDFLGKTFYHETWHLMESLIRGETYGKPNPFSDWETLNPPGFTYVANSNKDYTIFDRGRFESSRETVSFMTAYGKTSPQEDRAEVFADLMFRPMKKDYMAAGFGVNEKAKKLSLITRNYFKNSIGAPWEKNITW